MYKRFSLTGNLRILPAYRLHVVKEELGETETFTWVSVKNIYMPGRDKTA